MLASSIDSVWSIFGSVGRCEEGEGEAERWEEESWMLARLGMLVRDSSETGTCGSNGTYTNNEIVENQDFYKTNTLDNFSDDLLKNM